MVAFAGTNSMLEPKHKAACGCDEQQTITGLLSVDEAADLANSLVCPVRETETVDLQTAIGRVLARDIHAPNPMPFFDNSAMDGYAVRTRDLEGSGPWRIAVAGTVAAGDANCASSNADRIALRIFTGAPVPGGFDAVVIQERCRMDGVEIAIPDRPRKGQNIRYSGSDIVRGAVIAAAGTVIDPRHVGLLAANGYASASVFRRVRIGVLSTGDELTTGEIGRGPSQIFDANRPMLIALAKMVGAAVTDLGIVPDDREGSIDLIRSIRDRFDLVISSGGVSVGGRDYLKSALEQAGGAIVGWRVAVKPGKPVMFGRLGAAVFMGLPGNPLAAFVAFHLFVRPQIASLSGSARGPAPPHPAIARFDWRRKPGRAEYFPVRLAGHDSHGAPLVERMGNGGSAALCPLSTADGLGVVSALTELVSEGDLIAWHPFCTGFA